MSTTQMDLFADPAPVAAPPAMETRGCGTCSGKGSYSVFKQHSSGVRDHFPTMVTCPDCLGEKKLTVPVKPPCPVSAVSHVSEPGIIKAMIDFTRAMTGGGYGAKITTGGDLDQRKAKQCCNALLRGVASDRPEPTKADWESCEILVGTDPDFNILYFSDIADDPDTAACARRVAGIEARIKDEKARAKK